MAQTALGHRGEVYGRHEQKNGVDNQAFAARGLGIGTGVAVLQILGIVLCVGGVEKVELISEGFELEVELRLATLYVGMDFGKSEAERARTVTQKSPRPGKSELSCLVVIGIQASA